MTETVMKEEEVLETLTFEDDLFENSITFELQGQNVDRSYEDRSVYFKVGHDDEDCITEWLKGEDAITLGMALIKHGQFALKANMINHQLIHATRQLKKYVADGRVWFLKFTVVDENPVNYGRGHRTYQVKPIWRRGQAPEYSEDFQLETVVYWSPNDDEFTKQVERWTDRKCLAVFEGYDRDKEVEEFNKEMEDMIRANQPKPSWDDISL